MFWKPNITTDTKSILMEADMAEKNATGKLEKQASASQLGEQNHDPENAVEMADAKLLQESTDALQALEEAVADTGLMDPGYGQVYHDAAEDADDELGTDEDNDYVEIPPLNIRKVKTGKDGDQGMQHFILGDCLVVAERIKAESSLVSSSVHKSSWSKHTNYCTHAHFCEVGIQPCSS